MSKEPVENEHFFDSKLHITQRKVASKVASRVGITVTCGVQKLVVILDNNQWNAVSVNGKDESLEQGRAFLRRHITLLPESEFPRYGVKDTQTHEVSYQPLFETARLWKDDLIRLTKEIIDENLEIRRATPDELADLLATASGIEWCCR